jgi:hypothetical protein
MRNEAESADLILPIEDGEGNHSKHGGGVSGSACSGYPSTTLRVVPLPKQAWGG